VEAKDGAVNSIEQRLLELDELGVPKAPLTNAVTPRFARWEKMIEDAQLQLEPLTLVAPQAGMVHFVYRQPGETVVAGESLFSISPPRSERIVGYLRQPYTVDLQIGAKVEVVTRERPRRRFELEVAQVGARVEVITNTLAIMPMNTLWDAGLPFVIPLPDDLNLRPGEIVDVRFRRSGWWFGRDTAASEPPPAAFAAPNTASDLP
jgi:hypothetical protein